MGIVLKSVGTKDLTLTDWIKGCSGGLAAYVAMLIFTREVTTAQIARATSVVTGRLAGPKPSPAQDFSVPDRDANDADQSEHTELTHRRADGARDARDAFNLGVRLHQRGDFAAAAAAYGRAEVMGDRDAAFNLGILLYEQGDLDGAEAAWRRSMSHHHAQAAANLGFLLQRRGDVEGAREANAAAERWAAADRVAGGVEQPVSPTEHAELTYRRADEAGDAVGAFNLGVLLYKRGEFAAAAAAYERAELRGNRDAAFNLGVLLYEQGDLDGAEAAWRRCVSRHDARAAANLGFLLERRGDLDGAERRIFSGRAVGRCRTVRIGAAVRAQRRTTIRVADVLRPTTTATASSLAVAAAPRVRSVATGGVRLC